MPFLSIGHERLKVWLDEQRARPTLKVELARQQLFCCHCERELAVRFGRYSEAFFVVHFECGGLCPLEFRTWWGKLRSEAIKTYVDFSYDYRPEESPPPESPPGPPAGGDPEPDLEDINAALTEKLKEDEGDYPDDPYLR